MTSKKQKIFISGICFIIATVGYIVYRAFYISAYKNFFGIEYVNREVWHILCAIVYNAIFITYCFVLNKKKYGKTIYLFGIGISALSKIYFMLWPSGVFRFLIDMYTISDILFFAIMIFMMIAEIKINTAIQTIVTILFLIYMSVSLAAILAELFYVTIDHIFITFLVYFVAEFIAFFSLWQFRINNLLLIKKQTLLSKTNLENELIKLKRLVDNGMISKEEYNQKKEKILDKL